MVRSTSPVTRSEPTSTSGSRSGSSSGKQGDDTCFPIPIRRQLRCHVAAIDSLEAAHAIPPLPGEGEDGPIKVRFEIGQAPSRGRRSIPISIVTQPTWILEKWASSMPGNPHPLYPLQADAKRIPGEVLVSFVVGPDGRAIFSTARMLKGGRYRDFQVAVLEVLPRMRFDPARIADCPVAQLVQMPFSFRVPHSD